MPGQYVVPPNVPAWLVVRLGLKVVKSGLKDVSGFLVVVVLLVGLGVVMLVVGLNVVVVLLVGCTDVVVVDVEASSSMQPTKGSPVLPAPQKHSSPLSVTFWQITLSCGACFLSDVGEDHENTNFWSVNFCFFTRPQVAQYLTGSCRSTGPRIAKRYGNSKRWSRGQRQK